MVVVEDRKRVMMPDHDDGINNELEKKKKKRKKKVQTKNISSIGGNGISHFI